MLPRDDLSGHDRVPAERILITGGAGFLGAHLTTRLQREGFRVRVLDLVDTSPATWAPGVEYVSGDVRDRGAVAAALDGVGVVLHAAFASPREPRDVVGSVNVDGTRNVCEAAVRRGARRVVLVSSMIVIGPRRAHPLFRNSPLTRLDLYRASRAEAERLLADLAPLGLSSAIARPKTFVGPGRVSMFALIFEEIRRGQAVPVLGDGRNRYQLLDVRDLADGLARLLTSDASGVFFFGARRFGTVREDLQGLLDHARTGSRLRFVPTLAARIALRGIELINLVPASEWHYRSAWGEDSVVDVRRAEEELGWRPVRSNAEALVAAYDWYVDSVRTTGTAPTTHPVPRAHRALTWIVSR